MWYVFSVIGIILLSIALLTWRKEVNNRHIIAKYIRDTDKQMITPKVEVFYEKKRVTPYQVTIDRNKQLEYNLREKLKKENRL